MYTYQDNRLSLRAEKLNEVVVKYNVKPETFLQAIYCSVLGTYNYNKFLLYLDGYSDGVPAYKIDVDLSISLA